MKAKLAKGLTLAIESVNYIIIEYALSNMAIFFHSSLLYILFFASEIWVTENYWEKILKETKNRAVTGILLVCCFFLHIGMVYWTGFISGALVPWSAASI